jgi:toxin FitB
VYLIDTDVISELRKKDQANPGVLAFFKEVSSRDTPVYLAAVTIGELRRGVELIRYRGDSKQAQTLERWLSRLLADYRDNVLSFDEDVAQVWSRLRVPHPERPLDKQIAATALIHDLVLVTRNVKHFAVTGVKLINPFSA